MRILVTGGYGFIGSNLVKKLLSSKNLSIYNIDKLGYASNSTFIEDSIDESNKNNYHFFELDLVKDKELDVQKIKPSLIQRFFDRLYFSVTTGTTLGYGDIYPTSNSVKFLSFK